MKTLIKLPPKEYLNECFSYDPTSGELTWKTRPISHFKEEYAWKRFNSKNAGKTAGIKLFRDVGKTSPICLRVKFQYQGVKIFPSAHRIIFELLGIPIPEGHYIDHANGNPFDNRLENLRAASPSQNTQNKRNQRNRKYDLPKGVHLRRNGKFRAAIMIEGKSSFLGMYDTAEEAHSAYCAVAKVLHGEFHRAS